MKKKFKSIAEWKIKERYTHLDLIGCFFDSFKYKSDGLISLGILKGKLTGTDLEKIKILDNLAAHYRCEGIWMLQNDLIDIKEEIVKNDKVKSTMFG